MKYSNLAAFFLAVLCSESIPVAYGQIAAELATDKSSYGYGEPIVAVLKLSNPTSEVIQFQYSCVPRFSIDSFSTPFWCLAAEINNYFSPGSWRTYTYILNPAELGVPSYSGEHTLVASFHTFEDQTVIDAPMYLGGQISIEFVTGTTQDIIDTIRNSLTGVVKNSRVRPNGNTLETWEISGITIDEAIAQYHGHVNVANIDYASVGFDYIQVAREGPGEMPSSFVLEELYPNPFRVNTTIRFTLPNPSPVTIELYGLQGKRVTMIAHGYRAAGEHVDASDLSPGVYFLRMTAGVLSQTRKMVVVE